MFVLGIRFCHESYFLHGPPVMGAEHSLALDADVDVDFLANHTTSVTLSSTEVAHSDPEPLGPGLHCTRQMWYTMWEWLHAEICQCSAGRGVNATGGAQ